MHAPPRSLAPFALIAFAASVSCLSAAEPFLEKTDLFEARKGGYHTYRIPGVVVTKQGTILAYCEARKDGQGDWVNIDVLLRRSTDGGRTWSEPTTMADAGDLPAQNPTAIVDRQGTIHFLNCVNLTVKMSLDDGATWPVSRVLEPGISAYSDLAVGPNGAIYCLYERAGVNDVMWDTKFVTLARFNLQWLEQGGRR